MLDEFMMQERLRDLAREAEQWRRGQAARCSQSQAADWTRPLRRQVGRWLVASGRRLAGDTERPA